MKTFALAGLLTMSTLAAVAFATEPTPMTRAPVELDGAAARAVAAALPSFAEKVPGARIEDYIVHVNPPADDTVQVVFEPRRAPGETPVLGGRTAAGAELNVWVKTGDYSIERVSFAR